MPTRRAKKAENLPGSPPCDILGHGRVFPVPRISAGVASGCRQKGYWPVLDAITRRKLRGAPPWAADNEEGHSRHSGPFTAACALANGPSWPIVTTCS
jgi:hypothetical protein